MTVRSDFFALIIRILPAFKLTVIAGVHENGSMKKTAPIVSTGAAEYLIPSTHRTSISTFLFPVETAGCCAVIELVSRALLIGKFIIHENGSFCQQRSTQEAVNSNYKPFFFASFREEHSSVKLCRGLLQNPHLCHSLLLTHQRGRPVQNRLVEMVVINTVITGH